MKRTGEWKIVVTAALTAGALVGASLTLVAYSGGWNAFAIADVDDRKAYALLNSAPSPARVRAAAAAAQRALQHSPYSNTSRLRLAYIYTLPNGSLGPAGRAELAQSYDLIPLDHTVAAWRVRFALDHWVELPPELREQVQQEVMAFGRLGSRDADVRMALRSVRSPEGRVAATLWLTSLALEQLRPSTPPAQTPSAQTPVTGHSR